MASYHNPMQLRASSSAFAWGTLIYTDYKTGCLRKILVQSKGHQTPIDPKYGELGAYNEDRHGDQLARLLVPFNRESKFERDLSHGVTISGHADFVICEGGEEPTEVHELKSVSSKNSRRNVIKHGQYLTENLAQLVCYMWAFDVCSGRLIYTYYENKVALDERIFAVAIDEFGRINVDSKPSKFTIYDLFSHQAQAATVIAHGAVAQRPLNWDAPFVSPCKFCQFSKVCDDYDSGVFEGSEAFVNLCKSVETEK